MHTAEPTNTQKKLYGQIMTAIQAVNKASDAKDKDQFVVAYGNLHSLLAANAPDAFTKQESWDIQEALFDVGDEADTLGVDVGDVI